MEFPRLLDYSFIRLWWVTPWLLGGVVVVRLLVSCRVAHDLREAFLSLTLVPSRYMLYPTYLRYATYPYPYPEIFPANYLRYLTTGRWSTYSSTPSTGLLGALVLYFCLNYFDLPSTFIQTSSMALLVFYRRLHSYKHFLPNPKTSTILKPLNQRSFPS